MNTCLSGIWNILLEDITEIKRENHASVPESVHSKLSALYEEQLYKKAFIFCNSMGAHCPEHFKVFYRELGNNGSTFVQAAQSALRDADNCALCVGCIRCSRKFYEAVLSDEKKERPLAVELSDYFGNYSQFYYYLSSYKSVKEYRKIKNTLICLKGFSSTTPAVYSAAFENACTGGGLYLNVDGYGIAIDPGIGFVDSMHEQGIFIEDIDRVIVTHNHLDHNNDLAIISSLQYDINRYYKKQRDFYKKFFPEIKKYTHKIEWILDRSTGSSMRHMINESEDFTAYNKWKVLTERVSMSAISTQHIENGESYGLKFRIEGWGVIGYTSDTKFFPELLDFFSDVSILILHISDIYEKDVRGIKSKNSHLGYDGCINLLAGSSEQLKLAIVSEFCCTNGDYRIKIVKKLSEQVQGQKDICIIPGEVGLKVDLDERGICCSQCKKVTSLEAVSVIAPKTEFGPIQYVCENCHGTWEK